MAQTAPKHANLQRGYLMLKTLSLLYSRHVFFRGTVVLAKAGLGRLHQSTDCSTGAPNAKQSDLYCSLGPRLEISFSPWELKGESMRKLGKPRGSSRVPPDRRMVTAEEAMGWQLRWRARGTAVHSREQSSLQDCDVGTNLARGLGSR